MNIIDVNINELKPYENNPRVNDKTVKYLVESIREFGFKVPIVIDKDNIVVAGHTRLKAAKKLKLETIPCIVVDDLTPEQIKAFRLADNKVAEFSEWDTAKLMRELDELKAENFEMSVFGFLDDETEKPEGAYSKKTNIPQYEIQGESPGLAELCDGSKCMSLADEIEASTISAEEKDFLLKAAGRHNVFNYRKIAEYYAQASPEMQALMEKSALVIIDLNDAIKNGYAKLEKRIEEMRYEDNA